MSWTVPVVRLMVPPLLLVLVAAVELKVIVLPLTTIVLPFAKPAPLNELVPAVPTNVVAPVMGADC